MYFIEWDDDTPDVEIDLVNDGLAKVLPEDHAVIALSLRKSTKIRRIWRDLELLWERENLHNE